MNSLQCLLNWVKKGGLNPCYLSWFCHCTSWRSITLAPLAITPALGTISRSQTAPSPRCTSQGMIFPVQTRMLRTVPRQPEALQLLGAAGGYSSSCWEGGCGILAVQKRRLSSAKCMARPQTCKIEPSNANTINWELLQKKQWKLTAVWWGLSAKAVSQDWFNFL